jgi:hypothetical protein
VAVAIDLGGIDKRLDFSRGQMLAGPKLCIWPADGVTVQFLMVGNTNARRGFATEIFHARTLLYK